MKTGFRLRISWPQRWSLRVVDGSTGLNAWDYTPNDKAVSNLRHLSWRVTIADKAHLPELGFKGHRLSCPILADN